MIKPNEILGSGFLNMKLFPHSEPKILLKNSIGENEKGLLVTIFENESQNELLPFLEKILGAVQFEMKKDALLLTITDKTVFGLMEVCRYTKKDIQHILFFGQTAKQVGLNLQLPKYQPTTIGGKKILFADDLAVIQADNNLKKALWGSLQAMFLQSK